MSNVILPTNPADRKAILDVMQEISNAYTRVEGERAYISEAVGELSKKFNIPKQLLNKLSRVLHKGNFDQEVGKFEDFSDLYETLLSSEKAKEE